MNAVALDLMRRGVRGRRHDPAGGRHAPAVGAEPLPDHLRARLRQHKPEIVALLSAAEPANDARRLPSRTTGLARTCRAEVADGVGAILAADGARGVPPIAGRRSSAIRISWSNVGWLQRRSTSAGSRPTCSAAIRGRRGTGSTALASSC